MHSTVNKYSCCCRDFTKGPTMSQLMLWNAYPWRGGLRAKLDFPGFPPFAWQVRQVRQ